MKDDTIYRQAAIDVLHGYFDGMLETDTICPKDLYNLFEIIPSTRQETSFITWLLDAIWDDEMWELNWQAFPEIVCRKLAKLGYLMEKDGEYERLDK